MCGSCPDVWINIIRLVGIGILVIGVCAVLVRSSIRSAYQPKALHSIYMKIFANYMQLVMLTSQFRLDWPEEVVQLLSFQEQSGQATDQLFSFDCFLNFGEETSYKQTYFLKLTIMAFLPLLLGLGSVLFWGVRSCIKKDRSVMKRELVTTLCVIFFLIHPTITRLMFSMFSCL